MIPVVSVLSRWARKGNTQSQALNAKTLLFLMITLRLTALILIDP